MPAVDVSLRVYDISDGAARTWSPVLLGKRIEGVWHTGVLIFGLEYFYGGGIVKMRPADVERIYGLTPLRVHHLGQTQVQQREFEKYLVSLQSSFSRDCYDIMKWNCNNFSDHVVHYLTNNNHGIPKYILDQPEAISKTFMGKIIVNFIRMFSDAPAIDSEAADHPRQQLAARHQKRDLPAATYCRGRRNSCPGSPTHKSRGGGASSDDPSSFDFPVCHQNQNSYSIAPAAAMRRSGSRLDMMMMASNEPSGAQAQTVVGGSRRDHQQRRSSCTASMFDRPSSSSVTTANNTAGASSIPAEVANNNGVPRSSRRRSHGGGQAGATMMRASSVSRRKESIAPAMSHLESSMPRHRRSSVPCLPLPNMTFDGANNEEILTPPPPGSGAPNSARKPPPLPPLDSKRSMGPNSPKSSFHGPGAAAGTTNRSIRREISFA